MDLEGEIISTIPAARRSPMALRNSLFAFIWPDGRGVYDGKLAVLNLKTRSTDYMLASGSNMTGFGAMDPKGIYLAWGDKIWDLPGNKIEAAFSRKVLDVSFQNRTAAITDWGGHAKSDLSILDWKTGRLGGVQTDSYPRKAKFTRWDR